MSWAKRAPNDRQQAALQSREHWGANAPTGACRAQHCYPRERRHSSERRRERLRAKELWAHVTCSRADLLYCAEEQLLNCTEGLKKSKRSTRLHLWKSGHQPHELCSTQVRKRTTEVWSPSTKEGLIQCNSNVSCGEPQRKARFRTLSPHLRILLNHRKPLSQPQVESIQKTSQLRCRVQTSTVGRCWMRSRGRRASCLRLSPKPHLPSLNSVSELVVAGMLETQRGQTPLMASRCCQSESLRVASGDSQPSLTTNSVILSSCA